MVFALRPPTLSYHQLQYLCWKLNKYFLWLGVLCSVSSGVKPWLQCKACGLKGSTKCWLPQWDVGYIFEAITWDATKTCDVGKKISNSSTRINSTAHLSHPLTGQNAFGIFWPLSWTCMMNYVWCRKARIEDRPSDTCAYGAVYYICSIMYVIR